MYDKITHTNVGKKHAYKCMIKTCIQMYEKKTRIQMSEKTHTKLWKKQAYKHAYKFMKKTRIQMYDKNAYKRMTKTRIQNRIQVY